MLRVSFLHPTGQIPAYEWNFSDVNPPVHAWATIFLYRTEQALKGEGDLDFLKRSFAKLVLNFSWWVNRKDRFGKNLFEGGFLGLDNIGVFDRSAPLPTGGHLEQADGTAWVSLFCQNMLEISLELAAHDSSFEDMAMKFADHFLLIAHAMNHVGEGGMWDEEDGFYYDVLCLPDGSATRLKVRSMVGLLSLCATTVIEPWQREQAPRVTEILLERLRRMPELGESIHPTGPGHLGYGDRGIITLVNREGLRRILSRMLDENEFLSPYGIRALSRHHDEHPYVFNVGGQEYRVNYLPAESDTGMFGGNSNWRGPIWMPVNALLIRALLSFYLYYGDNFKIECPTELWQAAREQNRRVREKYDPKRVGGMNRTKTSRLYLFSSLLECGLCSANMVIVSGQAPNARYGCPNHRYRGVCKNTVTIPQRKLEQQLLAALSANLVDPRLEEVRVQSFRDQLKATLAAETRRTREAASQDSQLKEELAGLKKEQENLVDGIAKHGFSPALSARLAAVEGRISQIQRLRDAGVEPKVPEFTTEEIRAFVQRKSQDFANILAGDAATAREQLRKRITKLVLTPKQTPDGSVFEVTGDVSLFQGNGDVMLTNSLEGIAQHYVSGSVSLVGVILDPSLPLSA
jgi:hypothetical protein